MPFLDTHRQRPGADAPGSAGPAPGSAGPAPGSVIRAFSSLIGGFGLAQLFKLLAGVVAVVVVYLAVTVAQVWWTARQNDAPKAQAIVVMGAAEYDGTPSPVLKARLTHALSLWRSNLAPVIVVTGGREEGDRFTEAGVEAIWLEARQVPASAIIEEKRGRDSYESIAAARDSLEPLDRRRLIMVSDPFNEDRIVSMVARLGLVAYPSPTRTSPIRGAAVVGYYARETLAVGVGRIIGYQALSNLLHP
ncbi:MAG: YdcF family protein [Acidimicrobiales bacterium]